MAACPKCRTVDFFSVLQVYRDYFLCVCNECNFYFLKMRRKAFRNKSVVQPTTN